MKERQEGYEGDQVGESERLVFQLWAEADRTVMSSICSKVSEKAVCLMSLSKEPQFKVSCWGESPPASNKTHGFVLF